MTPNPNYKPLTEAQFKGQWQGYLNNNPDVKVEFGNDFDSAWFHYSVFGIDDIKSGFRRFDAQTPTLIRDIGVRYPTEFGLIDKNGKITPKFLQNAPETARQYILDNYDLHDADKRTFNKSDLDYLKSQGITNVDEIARVADRFGTEQMDLATQSLFRKNEILDDKVRYKLVDPKTEKHTPAFLQYFPEDAANYIADNFYEKYDANKNDFTQADLNILEQAKVSPDRIRDIMGNYGLGSIATAVANKYIPEQRAYFINTPDNYRQEFDTGPAATPGQALGGTKGVFDANDLAFLRQQKVPEASIEAIARSYGIDKIAPALLKYNASNKTYATPELAPIAADIFANYGKFEVGEKGIFDATDARLLRDLGYTDADIINRARSLFGEDRLSNTVIQQYFPDLATKKSESLYLEGPLDIRGAPLTERPAPAQPQEPVQPPSISTPSAPLAPTTQAPSAPTVSQQTSFPSEYYSWFKGIPGPSEAAPPAPVITGPAARNPVIEYFANTPIASPFPTLPYRFQTLTPENVNLRQGLGTLPTSTPLIQAPAAAPAQFATPAAAPTITAAPPFAPTPFGINMPTTQYIGPAPTVAQLQALQARTNVVNPPLTPAQEQAAVAELQAASNALPGSSTAVAPVATPVTGRMGGMVSFAEGGMPKLTPPEAGSQVDVREYIDPKTGRFYINEFKRDEVFGPQLRNAEAAKRLAYEADPALRAEEEMLADRQRTADTLMYNYGVRRPRPFGYAEGGVASLAENLASRGRGTDSMLVHMSPDEVAGLQSLAQQYGTSLTINPDTGLPEALKLKKVFKAVAPALPFLVPGLGSLVAGLGANVGLSAIASKAVAAGIIGGFTAKGGGFNFKEGLKTGLTAFAGAKAFEALNSAAAAQQAGAGGAGSAGSAGGADVNVFGSEAAAADAATQAATAPITASDLPGINPPPAVTTTTAKGPAFDYTPSGEAVPVGTGAVPPSPSQTPMINYAGEPGAGPATTISGDVPVDKRSLVQKGLDLLPTPTIDFSSPSGIANTAKDLAMTGYLGTSAVAAKEAMDEQEKYEEEQRRLEEEERRRRQQYDALFSRTLGTVSAAGGGIVALNRGGMPTFEYGGTTAPTGEPRMVQGAGDGMSDNVPANIEGVQEARLANDEFVVPADVVADIGNGSSNAGAKKLYAMMDRVRKARHGTVKQPPEINAESLMPA